MSDTMQARRLSHVRLEVPRAQKARWVRAACEQSPDPAHPQALAAWIAQVLDRAASPPLGQACAAAIARNLEAQLQQDDALIARLEGALRQAKALLMERYHFEAAAALVAVLRDAEARLRHVNNLSTSGQ